MTICTCVRFRSSGQIEMWIAVFVDRDGIGARLFAGLFFGRLLEGLAAGTSGRFELTLDPFEDSVTVTVSHARAGRATLPVLRPRSPTRPVRKEYAVEPGFATPDKARRATNEYYENGVTDRERGPAFTPPRRKSKLRVAVILALPALTLWLPRVLSG